MMGLNKVQLIGHLGRDPESRTLQSGGTVVTLSGGHPPGSVVSIPANQWANGAKSHQPGNLGGANPMRDIPRFVRLIEAGLFNAKALATATFPLERTREAFQAVADRTTVAAVIVYS